MKRGAAHAKRLQYFNVSISSTLLVGCGNILGIIFFYFGNYFFSMVSIGGGDVSGGGGLSLQRR